MANDTAMDASPSSFLSSVDIDDDDEGDDDDIDDVDETLFLNGMAFQTSSSLISHDAAVCFF